MNSEAERLITELGGKKQPDGSYEFSQTLSREQKAILENAGIKFIDEPIFVVGQSFEEASTEKTLSDSQTSDSVVAAASESVSEEHRKDESEQTSTTPAPVKEEVAKEETKSFEDVLAENGNTALHKIEGIKDFWNNKCGSVGKKVKFEKESEKEVLVKISDDKNNEEFKYVDRISSATVITKKDETPHYDYFDLLVKRAKNAGYGVIKIKDGCTLEFQTKLMTACAKNNVEPIGNVPPDFEFETYKNSLRDFKDNNEANDVIEKNIGKINPGKASTFTTLSLATLMMFSGCNRNGELVQRIDNQGRKIDSLENVINIQKDDICDLQENTLNKNDTVKFAIKKCNGKEITGYEYFDHNTQTWVFKESCCDKEKKAEEVILKSADKINATRTRTSKTEVVKKTEVRTEAKKETVKLVEAPKFTKQDTLYINPGDTINVEGKKLLIIGNMAEIKNDTLYVSPGDTLVSEADHRSLIIGDTLVPDTVKVTQKVYYPDGIYGSADAYGIGMSGVNGPQGNVSDSYATLSGEAMLGVAKMLKDSTVVFAEARGTGVAMGNMIDTDDGFNRQYGTFIKEYAASMGVEFKDVTLEATAGRQKLNTLTKKYVEMNFLDQLTYGQDAAYISDVVALKGTVKGQNGREHEVLLGLAGQTPKGSFFAGPGEDGFFVASNNKNLFSGQNLGVDLGAGVQSNDGNLSGYGTVIFHDYKNKIAAEYTYAERNNPHIVQAISHIGTLGAVFGENDKFDVKLKYVNEDGYYKKMETYGASANWNILNGSKVEGRNSWKHKLSVGLYADLMNGQYNCGCCQDGKIHQVKVADFKNQIHAGLKVKLNLGAAKKRHNMNKGYDR